MSGNDDGGRAKWNAFRIRSFPLVEHALDCRAHGGPNMVSEAEALMALILDFAERMERDAARPT